MLFIVALLALACWQPANAQDEAAAESASAESQAWQELRAKWQSQMLAEIEKDDSAIQEAAVEYLASNPPREAGSSGETAWNAFVRDKLLSDDLEAVNEGMELLESTSLGFEDRTDSLRAALATAADYFISKIAEEAGDKAKLLATARMQYEVKGGRGRETPAASIVKRAEYYFTRDAELYANVVESMLASEQPVPTAYYLLSEHGTGELAVAKRLQELSRSEDASTAKLASQAMNAVFQKVRNEREKDERERSVMSDKYLSYANRIIARYDNDKDGNMTAEEWKGMLIDPTPADADGDGKVSVGEYADWLQSRSGSR